MSFHIHGGLVTLWVPKYAGVQVPHVKWHGSIHAVCPLHLQAPNRRSKQYRYLLKKPVYQWIHSSYHCSNLCCSGSTVYQISPPYESKISIHFHLLSMQEFGSFLPCLAQKYFSVTSESPRVLYRKYPGISGFFIVMFWLPCQAPQQFHLLVALIRASLC